MPAWLATTQPSCGRRRARVKIRIEGIAANGFDPSWLRNAVDEPLDEANIERISED